MWRVSRTHTDGRERVAELQRGSAGSSAWRDLFLIPARHMSAFPPRDSWLTLRSQELQKAEVLNSVLLLQEAAANSTGGQEVTACTV